MPINKIMPSKRAAAAIAAIVGVTISGFVALFPGQAPVHDDVALAVKTLVQPWEGRSLTAYLDRLAKPAKWTICDGDTTNVKAGMVETPAGCDQRLAVKMERDYRPPLVSCIAGWQNKPLSWRSMMISLSWNIGTGGACGSTAARIVNDATRTGQKPNYEASCKAATAFNKAGGRVYIGLVNRREMGDSERIGEAELCVTGLK
jgi:GH24 family phage-related lysozyme (muramidase)